MTVRELIEKLGKFNPDAEVGVIAHNFRYTVFDLTWGGAEGTPKSKCEEVGLYLSALNDEEDEYVLKP